MVENAKDNAVPESTRRRFLNLLWAGLGLATVAEVVWIGVSFLRSRKERSESVRAESVVAAGPVDSFAPGSVTAIPQGQFYLSRLADGGFLALSRTCTHLGCSLRWDPDKGRFFCPCHGSSFSATGEVLTSPAPRPLDCYPVRIENGMVKVDVSAPHKRDWFSPEQAARIS